MPSLGFFKLLDATSTANTTENFFSNACLTEALRVPFVSTLTFTTVSGLHLYWEAKVTTGPTSLGSFLLGLYLTRPASVTFL